MSLITIASFDLVSYRDNQKLCKPLKKKKKSSLDAATIDDIKAYHEVIDQLLSS